MQSFNKMVHHNSYNLLSKFYNNISRDSSELPVFVGGCSFFILGVEYKSKKMDDKSVGNQPPMVYLQYTSAPAFFRIMNLFWFTYRSNFPTLPASKLTTDVGWGCTIRSVQMMVSNAMQQILYSKQLNNTTAPYSPSTQEKLNVVVPFVDVPNPTSPLSIHHVYQSKWVTEQNVSGVNYLSPSTVATAYCDLINSWKLCVLRSIICNNSTIPKEELYKKPFKATLAFVPVVLNHTILSKLQTVYKSPLFSGIVGGFGDRAIFIFGFHALQLLYMDPHTVQSACTSISKIQLETYSTIELSKKKFEVHTIDPSKLDKFCTFGFLIRTEREIATFMKLVEDVFDIGFKKKLQSSSQLDGFEILDF
ncbi:Cysteine protease [Entamoeba marina]